MGYTTRAILALCCWTMRADSAIPHSKFGLGHMMERLKHIFSGKGVDVYYGCITHIELLRSDKDTKIDYVNQLLRQNKERIESLKDVEKLNDDSPLSNHPIYRLLKELRENMDGEDLEEEPQYVMDRFDAVWLKYRSEILDLGYVFLICIPQRDLVELIVAASENEDMALSMASTAGTMMDTWCYLIGHDTDGACAKEMYDAVKSALTEGDGMNKCNPFERMNQEELVQNCLKSIQRPRDLSPEKFLKSRLLTETCVSKYILHSKKGKLLKSLHKVLNQPGRHANRNFREMVRMIMMIFGIEGLRPDFNNFVTNLDLVEQQQMRDIFEAAAAKQREISFLIGESKVGKKDGKDKLKSGASEVKNLLTHGKQKTEEVFTSTTRDKVQKQAEDARDEVKQKRQNAKAAIDSPRRDIISMKGPDSPLANNLQNVLSRAITALFGNEQDIKKFAHDAIERSKSLIKELKSRPGVEKEDINQAEEQLNEICDQLRAPYTQPGTRITLARLAHLFMVLSIEAHESSLNKAKSSDKSLNGSNQIDQETIDSNDQRYQLQVEEIETL